MNRIERALFSVSDKRGIENFAKRLERVLDVEILSTGGTAQTLMNSGTFVTEVGDYTRFPEMMNGRVKTLHPKIHGGILFLRGNDEHEEQARKHGIKPIDLVVVNLYPFKETAAKRGVEIDEVIEQIDIGGPSMIRSASKNYRDITVVVDPEDYHVVLYEITINGGNTSLQLRKQLAYKAFCLTADYEKSIAEFFGEKVVQH